MRAVLLFFVCLLTFISIPVYSDQASPIQPLVDEPVFLKTPRQPHMVEERQQLNIYFRIDTDRCRKHYGEKDYSRACNRDLELKGRRILDGAQLSSKFAGELSGVWRWEQDHQLSFTPSEYWQAGMDYTVILDLDLMDVPPQVVLYSADPRRAIFRISAKALLPRISNFRFMQDPQNPDRKLVSARLTTNYPVMRDSLTSRIKFSMEEAVDKKLRDTGESFDFDITYHNDDSTSAALSLVLHTLPDKERYMRLRVGKRVEPKHGGKPSPAITQERVRIPSLDTWLELSDVQTAIMRSENGAPEQVVTLASNVKASPDALTATTSLYLLPGQHPIQGADKDEIYSWKASSEVSPEILQQSKKLALAQKTGKADATQFVMAYKAPPGRYVMLVVDKGIAAFGGFRLAQRLRKVMRVPDHPHDIRIMHEGSILPLNGERRLSLHARGTDRLDVEIAQIDPNAVHHFISQTSGDMRKAAFSNQHFNTDDIADIEVQSIPMAFTNPRESQYASIDFTPYMQDGKKGLFVLNIRGYRNETAVGQLQRRFVLVTDMGLLVKQNADHTLPVYVVSFGSGQPVAGAEVNVLGRNGQIVHMAKANAEGMALLPDLRGLSRENLPVAIIAEQDGDFAFIPYAPRDRALNYSRFNTAGNRPLAQGLNAYLFSDRGIYRPGETAQIGLVLKNSDWSSLPENLPLKTIITDPKGNKVLEREITFGADGLQEIALETAQTWLTGKYHAGLYLAHDGKRGAMLGGTTIKVEEFQPDRLKISTSFLTNGEALTDNKGWVQPKGLSARMNLQNLYGTPAANRRASAHVRLNPTQLHFKPYADYAFYNATSAPPRQVDYDLPDLTTDAEGMAEFNLNLEEQKAGSYAVSVELRGFEANSGRGVTAYDSILISPMAYAVGYKADGNIGWLRKGRKAKVDVIAVTPELTRKALAGLSLTLVRKTFASTLVRRDNGTYAYESVPRYEEMATKPFTIGAAGSDLNLPTGEIGDFVYHLRNDDGRVIAKIPFGVTGTGQRPQGLDREAVLHIKSDQSQYMPGSDIMLQITAPYTGAGLITLESDHVVSHKWFRTESTDTVQTIRVPEDFIGKGYINVAFIRDVKSREIYLSPLSYAVLPFTASVDKRRVDMTLDAPPTVKPGMLVDITYRADKQGRALIYAVDEGILQVARYRTPDPVDFFLLNRALQVSTTQMLDLLMPEYTLVRELSKQGGGAGAVGGVLQKHLNPFRRKTLAPAVYWSGIVNLDTVDKTLNWRVPGHFNGRLRLMAVAVSDDAIGAVEKPVTVRGDIVLTPNVPLFMAPGDSAQASVTIANNIDGADADKEFMLSLSSSVHLEVLNAPTEPVLIAGGTEKTLSFTLRATDSLGAASLNLTAVSGNHSQSAEARLSVRPPVARSTRLHAGYTENGHTNISLKQDFYPTLAHQQLSFSALPTSYISGLAGYLDAYPYGCTEQLLSRNFPKVSLYGLPEFAGKTEESHRALDTVVGMLRRRLTHDNGFSMWYGQSESHAFVTIYAVEFLTMAREAGIAVPHELVQKSLRHIREQVNTNITSLDDARIKAYGIFMLTRNGIVTTNEILHLLQYLETHAKQWPGKWSDDLIALYLAASYELLQQKELARETLAKYTSALKPAEITYKSSAWHSVWYNPLIKYARTVSILSRHFPQVMTGLDKDIVYKLASFVREQRYNTLSASFAIQALRDYMEVADDQLAQAQWSLLLDGQALALPQNDTGMLQAEIPITTTGMKISNHPQQPFFYTLTQNGYLKNLPQQPVTEGMEVTRRFETIDGAPVNGPVKIGDPVEAVITIHAHGDRKLDNIAIVDLLPAGFELEPESVGRKSTLHTVFIDKREDRIIAFASVPASARELRYRLRAVSKGNFRVPPPFAESMYDLTKRAMGHAGQIKVIDHKS